MMLIMYLRLARRGVHVHVGAGSACLNHQYYGTEAIGGRIHKFIHVHVHDVHVDVIQQEHKRRVIVNVINHEHKQGKVVNVRVVIDDNVLSFLHSSSCW